MLEPMKQRAQLDVWPSFPNDALVGEWVVETMFQESRSFKRRHLSRSSDALRSEVQIECDLSASIFALFLDHLLFAPSLDICLSLICFRTLVRCGAKENANWQSIPSSVM